MSLSVFSFWSYPWRIILSDMGLRYSKQLDYTLPSLEKKSDFTVKRESCFSKVVNAVEKKHFFLSVHITKFVFSSADAIYAEAVQSRAGDSHPGNAQL